MQLCVSAFCGFLEALFILLVLAYKVAHSLSSTVYLRLHGTHRKVQFFGYLVVGVILKKTHRKELAILLWQTTDIVLYLRALLHIYKVLFG